MSELSQLIVTGLTYQVADKTLVDNAAFTVPTGSVTALIGPNGAGKTTLLHLMAGILPADPAGPPQVNLAGRNILGLPRRERARAVALLEQQATTEFVVTVAQTVALGRIPHANWWGSDSGSTQQIVQAMEQSGVAQWADRQLHTLSGGEQQRVHLARALAQQSPLLLLDEPINHLDIAAQLDLFQLLHRLAATGMTIVVALHDLAAAAAHCDHAVVMDAGQVRAAGVSSVVLTPEILEEIYGVRVDILQHPATGARVLAFSRP